MVKACLCLITFLKHESRADEAEDSSLLITFSLYTVGLMLNRHSSHNLMSLKTDIIQFDILRPLSLLSHTL